MAKRLIHYDKDGVTSWIGDAASGLKGDGFNVIIRLSNVSFLGLT